MITLITVVLIILLKAASGVASVLKYVCIYIATKMVSGVLISLLLGNSTLSSRASSLLALAACLFFMFFRGGGKKA